nr:MAG TPA: tail-collar fiber protein [Bacteriophage sp.]
MIVFLLMMTVVFFTTRKEIKMAFNFYMTEFGLSATIHSLAGGKITIDNVEIGSSATAPTDYNAVKNLLNRELQAQIISQKKIDNTLNLKFQFDNKKVTNDFFWTEIAVFATVTKADNSIETGIIIYGYNEENANHIPAYTDNNSLSKFICQIGINYSDELNVTIKLDEFNDYVENSKFTEHLNSENPHGITPDIINAAKAEHCHSANDITSGVLSVERGGTGTASLLELTQSLIPSIFNTKGIANTNLDSILSPGIYFVFNGCSNCPVTYNGILFVFEIDKGSFYQCYLPNYGGRYYMRDKANNNDWSNWQ